MDNMILEELESGTEFAEQSSPKEKKRRMAASAVALVTSASMLIGGLFSSPANLVDNGDLLPHVICSENDSDDLDGGGDDGDGQSGAGTEEEAVIAAEAEAAAPPDVWDDVRRRLLRLPLGVRMLVILPLAALGWLLVAGVSALCGPVIGPIAAKLLSWILLLGALTGGFVLAAKTVFPDLPIRRILNRRSVKGILLGGAALALADIVLPLFWTEYTRVEAAARAVGILLVSGTVTGCFALREQRRRRETPAEEDPPPEPAEEKRALSREDILALADSVSRRKVK